MSLDPTTVTAIGAILAGLAATYVVLGLILDGARALHSRVSATARSRLSTVIFADEEEAEVMAGRLARVSPRILLPMVQRLAADLDGDADHRLHQLVASSGMVGSISRRMRSHRWRRRAQAAALAPLLAEGDPRRTVLLHDRHPTVRARAAAHLEACDVIEAIAALLAMLGDDNTAVRAAAQQALLRGDGRVVPHLAAYLEQEDGEGVSWALEVAAAMPDPRLYDAITRHTRADDPSRRAVATAAIAPDAHGAFLIGEILSDPDPIVRAAAAEAAEGPGGEVLAARLGELLSDQSWTVRLRAGQALATLGPVGALTLRHHLADPDPYARDMARRTLDDIAAREGRPVVPATVPPDLEPWPEIEAAA